MSKEKEVKKSEVEKKEPSTTKKQKTSTTRRRVNAKAVKDLDNKKGTATTPIIEDEKNSEVDSKETKQETLDDVLPKDYTPVHTKYGINAGYVAIPGRVFDFIIEHPTDWFINLGDYLYYGDNDFFLSLMFYIKYDGFVNVQNLQTNTFYKITLEDSVTEV